MQRIFQARYNVIGTVQIGKAAVSGLINDVAVVIGQGVIEDDDLLILLA